jgi:hypothetical protein
MYHTLAHPKTIDLLESIPSTKALARELCHKFNLFVMSHDEDYMTNFSKHNTISYARIMLTHQNGMPFGVIRTENTEDKSGKSAINYVVVSPIIQKSKGRGSERHTRESINLRSLLKNIEQDHRFNHKSLDIIRFFDSQGLYNRLVSRAEHKFKYGYSDSISISGSTAVSVFEYFFNNKAVSEESKNILETKFKQYLKEVDKKAKVDEVVNRFIPDCFMLIKQRHCPALVAKVSLLNKEDKNNKFYLEVQGDVKCYSEESALSADYPELSVAVKMFNTKHQLNVVENNDLYPIQSMMIESDDLDIDLDVYTSYSKHNGFDGVAKYNLFLTPVTKYE